jgi:hypothetical protein
MRLKLLRLAFLLTVTALLIGADQQPVAAASCCQDCIAESQEFMANCMQGGEIVHSPYCDTLAESIHYCIEVPVCVVCGGGTVCGWVLQGNSVGWMCFD